MIENDTTKSIGELYFYMAVMQPLRGKVVLLPTDSVERNTSPSRNNRTMPLTTESLFCKEDMNPPKGFKSNYVFTSKLWKDLNCGERDIIEILADYAVALFTGVPE